MTLSPTDPFARDDIRHRLIALKLRSTPARHLVIAAFLDPRPAPARLTAPDVYRKICSDGFSISLGTVYRVINELEQAGLLQREWELPGGGAVGKACYELRSEKGQACVIACHQCQRQVAFDDAGLMEQLQRVARLHGLPASNAAPRIDIVCAACAGHGA